MATGTAAQNEKSWKTEDEQILPKNNLPLVFFSLLLATFLVRRCRQFWDDSSTMDLMSPYRLLWTKQCMSNSQLLPVWNNFTRCDAHTA